MNCFIVTAYMSYMSYMTYTTYMTYMRAPISHILSTTSNCRGAQNRSLIDRDLFRVQV